MDKLLLLIPTLSYTIFDFLPGDETSGSYHPVSFLFCGSGTSRFMVCRANHEKAYGHGGYSGRGRAEGFRHSEGCASTPWNPTVRGWAVRRRYPVGTNGGIPARSARMTAENRGRGRVTLSAVILAKRGSRGQGLGGMTPWTRRLKASVIQRGAPAPRGIPRSGAVQCVVATLVEPSRGFFGRLRSL